MALLVAMVLLAALGEGQVWAFVIVRWQNMYV